MYGYVFYEKIVQNGGLADQTDAWFAVGGLTVLFIAAYRTLGPVMVGLACLFLVYVFFFQRLFFDSVAAGPFQVPCVRTLFKKAGSP